MAEALGVKAAKEKIIALTKAEGKKAFKEKESITVIGEVIGIRDKRVTDKGEQQDIILQSSLDEGVEIIRLKVTVIGDSVGVLKQEDIGTKKTFTGKAYAWEDRISYEMEYYILGWIGDETRKKAWSPWGKDDPPARQRRIAGSIIFNAAISQGKTIDEAIEEVIPERIDRFLGYCKPTSDAKPEESSEPEESQEDPFKD